MSALIKMFPGRHAARATAVALLLACATAGAQPTLAASSVEQADAHPIQMAARKDDQKQAPDVSPAQAARRASQKYGGRVLNVVLAQGPSGPYYRVKLLDGGSVRVVEIPAR